MYLTDEIYLEVGIFNRPQIGWRPSTQEEIDGYEFKQAKADKNASLDAALTAFREAGYSYSGDFLAPVWDSATTYDKYDIIKGSDGNYYQSLQDGNLNHDPVTPSPEYWSAYAPVFCLKDCALTLLGAKMHLNADDPERYTFYTKTEDVCSESDIDFDEVVKWTTFEEAYAGEYSRIMKKYNDYLRQIARCSTIAEVEAITISFAA